MPDPSPRPKAADGYPVARPPGPAAPEPVILPPDRPAAPGPAPAPPPADPGPIKVVVVGMRLDRRDIDELVTRLAWAMVPLMILWGILTWITSAFFWSAPAHPRP